MRVLAGCLIALALASPVPAQESDYNWSGAYLGAAGGLNRLDHNFEMPGVTFQTTEERQKLFSSASAFAGYNWQFSNGVIVGVEIIGSVYKKYDLIGLGNYRNAIAQYDDPSVFASAEAQILRSGSLQARMGYSFGRMAVIGSIGPSFASVKYWGVGGASDKSDLNAPYSMMTISENNSKTVAGLTVGLAAEFGITPNLSAAIKLEHSEWGRLATFPAKSCALCPMEKIKASISTQQVSLGLAYRF